MPYVTNPYLIPYHSTAVTRQIFKNNGDWSQVQILDQCYKQTTAATTARLLTLSGLQKAEGRGASFP